jgi:hypothetical protein
VVDTRSVPIDCLAEHGSHDPVPAPLRGFGTVRLAAHLRPEWEPSGAQRSSRWLNPRPGIPLFASIRFRGPTLVHPSLFRAHAIAWAVPRLASCSFFVRAASLDASNADLPRLVGWRSLSPGSLSRTNVAPCLTFLVASSAPPTGSISGGTACSLRTLARASGAVSHFTESARLHLAHPP